FRQEPLGRDTGVQDDHPRASRSSRISPALSENRPYFCWKTSRSPRSSAPISRFRRRAASVSASRSSPSRLRPCCFAWARNQPTTQFLSLRTRTSPILPLSFVITSTATASHRLACPPPCGRPEGFLRGHRLHNKRQRTANRLRLIRVSPQPAQADRTAGN